MCQATLHGTISPTKKRKRKREKAPPPKISKKDN